MKRIKLILAVASTMVMLLAMNAGPAMADSWDNHNWNDDNWDHHHWNDNNWDHRSWDDDSWDDNCIGVINDGSCIGVGEGPADVWNSWNDWNDWNDCFWWDGNLYCPVS
jgi:hypothetical protein